MHVVRVFAAFGFIIHVEYQRNQWQVRPALLTLFLWIGVLGQLASASMFATYIALAVIQQQGMYFYIILNDSCFDFNFNLFFNET